LRTAFTLRFLLKQCQYCKQTFDGNCRFVYSIKVIPLLHAECNSIQESNENIVKEIAQK